MQYEIKYDDRKNTLVGRIRGRLSVKEVAEIDAEGFQHAMEHPECRRILCDLQEAEMNFSVYDIFNFPRTSEKVGVKAGLNVYSYKMAFVVPDGAEIMKFLETVSANLGRNIRVFTDIIKAGDWLEEDAPAVS